MIETLFILMIFLWQGLFLSIAYYTSKIRSVVNNVPYRGFLREVAAKRINNDLLPVFDFTEYQNESLKKLNKRRNMCVAFFLLYSATVTTFLVANNYFNFVK